MKKLLSFLQLPVAAVCGVVAVFFCLYYYTRYQCAVTRLESMIDSFDQRLANLEAHKAKELTPVHVHGFISTTDHPEEDWLRRLFPSREHANDQFMVVDSKGRAFVYPEFRLPAGSTNRHEFEIRVEGLSGPVADAWLSHGEPYHDLAAFDQFGVYCPRGSNLVKLIVQPKTNASIKLRFDMVVLTLR
jgi:hypothetical protein